MDEPPRGTGRVVLGSSKKTWNIGVAAAAAEIWVVP